MTRLPHRRILHIPGMLVVACLAIGPTPASAQGHGRGAILDRALYDSLPRKARQVARAYRDLPQAVSLKEYAPEPGDQGSYGTCVAWSTAYGARTIVESLAKNRRASSLTTANAFSPAFLYKNVAPEDVLCVDGLFISAALDWIKGQGAVKLLEREKLVGVKDTMLSWYRGSKRYPISDYAILYEYSADIDFRVQAVKKSIAERKPVVIGMLCPDSFFTAKGAWNPTESPDDSYSGHAMVVVGYDDTQYGGAFEILNSWGASWGNDGYIWIPYAVFASFAYQSYEMIGDLADAPGASEQSGSVDVEIRGSNLGMPVAYAGDGSYVTRASYGAGTCFRYRTTNSAPAYVYAFAADDSRSPAVMIFPRDNTSPVLDYATNEIAFPPETGDRKDWIRLDTVPGNDYLVVLYSKRSLDIGSILSRWDRSTGSFPDRVASAVGQGYVHPGLARFEAEAMKFSATGLDAESVFGLLLTIRHK